MVATQITVVGVLGKFGSKFADRFLNSGFIVNGIDILTTKKSEINRLARYHQVDKNLFPEKSETLNLIKKTDILLLATPLDSTEKLIAFYGNQLSAGATMIDITSVKTPIVSAMLGLKRSDIEILSIHPLFGPGSDFKKENIAVIEIIKGKQTDNLIRLFQMWELRVTRLSAAEHDFRMAFIQTLSHALIIGLGQTGRAKNLTLDDISALTTPFNRSLLSLLDRIRKTDSKLYADIQIGNKYAVEFIDEFILQLRKIRSVVASKDTVELQKYIDDCGTWLLDKTEAKNG